MRNRKNLCKILALALTLALIVGMVKLTRDASAVTLYKAIGQSAAEVTVYVDGAPLPENARVAVTNAADKSYDVVALGGGKYAIQFKGHSPAKKGAAVKLGVFLEGNYDPAAAGVDGYKANGSVNVKVSPK